MRPPGIAPRQQVGISLPGRGSWGLELWLLTLAFTAHSPLQELSFSLLPKGPRGSHFTREQSEAQGRKDARSCRPVSGGVQTWSIALPASSLALFALGVFVCSGELMEDSVPARNCVLKSIVSSSPQSSSVGSHSPSRGVLHVTVPRWQSLGSKLGHRPPVFPCCAEGTVRPRERKGCVQSRTGSWLGIHPPPS